jgi:hypothetical protein
MPVLAEPRLGLTSLPDIAVRYVFLGVFVLVLVCLGAFMSRRTSSSQYSGIATSETSEKDPSMDVGLEPRSALSAKPRIQRPPQPPPFTPPTLEQTEMNFSSFESFDQTMEAPPRRRSYTKIMTNGAEVSGEIIVAEGWRRHTRVFGGGVCKACEESERRMSA